MLKGALASQPFISLPWGYVPFPNITFVLPIGPVPVPVVVTQGITFTTDISLRALFGLQANVDVGFNVGAGFAWVPGSHPFDLGHLEPIGYHDAHATWGSDYSDSQSLVQKILAKLGGDPSATTWLLGAGLKIVPLNVHFQEKLYGAVGAELELHLPYLNFQATWNLSKCDVTAVGTFGFEGQLNAIVTLGPLNTRYKLPIQAGYAWQLFSATLPLGCGPPAPTPPSTTTTTTTTPPPPPPPATTTTPQPSPAPPACSGYPSGIVGPGCSSFSTVAWWASGSCGLTGHELWTYAYITGAHSYAHWSFAGLPANAWYKVYAYIPSCGSNAPRAHYTIRDGDGGSGDTFVNQESYTNAWADLGYAYSGSSGSVAVQLGDDGNPSGTWYVGADAMKLERSAGPCPHCT